MLGTKAEALGSVRGNSTSSRAKIIVSIFAIVALYVLSLYVLQRRLAGLEASMRLLGVPYVFYGGEVEFKLGFMTESILGAIALLESILLSLLYRLLERKPWDRVTAATLVLGTLVMLVTSNEARFTSSDLYHYIFYGQASSLSSAYAAVAHPLYAPGYGGLRSVLREPVPPSVYGPLWQAGDHLLIATTHTLAGGVRAVRFANTVALLIIFGSLIALRARVALLAVVVLNPALYYMFVVQGHNDIFAVAAIVAGLAVLRRNLPIAIALGAVAGLVKVSVIGVALATLCTAGALRTRIGSSVAMLGLLIVCSLVLGGAPYLHAILFVGSAQTGVETSALQHFVRLAVQGLLGLIAVAAIVAAIGYRRFLPAAVFAFPAVSGLVHAWYFAWGLPYAFLEQRTAAITATMLPLITFLGDEALIDSFHMRFTTIVFGVIIVFALTQLYRRKLTLPLATAGQ